jgi:hypothetical protein
VSIGTSVRPIRHCGPIDFLQLQAELATARLDLDETRARLVSVTAERDRLADHILELGADLGAGALRAAELHAATLAALQSRLAAAESEADGLKARAETAEAELLTERTRSGTALAAARASAAQAATEARALLDEAKADAADERVRAMEAEKALETIKTEHGQRVTQLTESLAAAQSEMQALQASNAALLQRTTDAESAAAGAQQQCASVQERAAVELHRFASSMAEAESERAALQRELERSRLELDQATANVEREATAKAALQTELAATQAALAAATDDHRAAFERLQQQGTSQADLVASLQRDVAQLEQALVVERSAAAETKASLDNSSSVSPSFYVPLSYAALARVVRYRTRHGSGMPSYTTMRCCWCSDRRVSLTAEGDRGCSQRGGPVEGGAGRGASRTAGF